MYYTGPLKTWVDDLAARTPVPGGGSAAALVGAAGCACLSMVARFTIGRPGFEPVEAEMKAALEAIERTRAELGALVDEDVEEYAKITAAQAMPKRTDAEKAARKAALQDAFRAALEVPRRACRLARAALGRAAFLLERGNPHLASDAGVGAQCLACAFRSAWLNVEVNLASIQDAAFVSSVRAELDPLAAEVERTAAEVWRMTAEKVRGR